MSQSTHRIPFLYGNDTIQIATAEPSNTTVHTHRWTIYVRGVNGEDLSYAIRKVAFQLHESFEDPIRTVKQPPYEMTETGWGEFNVLIYIYPIDESQQPLVISHLLALYNHGNPANTIRVENYKDGVKCEYYDEMIIQNPSAEVREAITKHQDKTHPSTLFKDSLYSKAMEEKMIEEMEEVEQLLLAELEK